MKRIILASGSPRRRELLKQIGVDFEVKVSDKEEVTSQTVPEEIVKELSRQKAEDILRQLDAQEDVIVIGSDTMISYENEMLGKPKDYEMALNMLKRLQGNTHQVYTGVTAMVRQNGEVKIISFVEKTDVTMWKLSEEQIRDYLAMGESMDKAGAYAIQGRGTILIEKIQGDYNNVVGLPVARLYQELRKVGIEIC
ncbi:MAG: Maf family protein [Hespellia sp.]|nr:Maf family protein [Hespellia sp.]